MILITSIPSCSKIKYQKEVELALQVKLTDSNKKSKLNMIQFLEKIKET